ncbi:MAG: hypothetical protein AAF658_19600, partial [Myxococcota bacterium]
SVEIGAPMNGIDEVTASSEPARVIRVYLECADEASVDIRLHEQVTGATAESGLRIESHVGRERRLALAVAELVSESRESWREIPAPEVVTPAPWVRNPLPLERWSLRWSAGTQIPSEPLRPQLSLRGDVHLRLLSWMQVSGGLGLSYDETGIENGRLETTSTSASLVAWAQTNRLPVTLSVGVGLRYGIAWLSGEPDDPTAAQGLTISDPWGGPLVSLLGEVPIGENRLGLALEAGIMTATVTGRSFEENVGGLDGGWFGATVSFRHGL